MAYEMTQKVLFKHCDPAGIVFYPRIYEMINDAIEGFFETALDWPFEDIHKDMAVPTASAQTEFHAPSRHGDILTLTVQVTRAGRTSLGLETKAICNGQDRFTAMQTLVLVDAAGRPCPWPEPIKFRLTQLSEAAS